MPQPLNNPTTFPIENVKLRVERKAVVYISPDMMVRLSSTFSIGKVDGVLRGTRMGRDHQTAPAPAGGALGTAETARHGRSRTVERRRPASTCGQRATAASESAAAGDAPAGGAGAGMVMGAWTGAGAAATTSVGLLGRSATYRVSAAMPLQLAITQRLGRFPGGR